MKSTRSRTVPGKAHPVLLVGAASATADRIAASIAASGFSVTPCENVCYAEILAEQQYFEAAVYDPSLVPAERISLARTMRVRWPWMKLVCLGGELGAPVEPGLFDASVASESELGRCLLDLVMG